MRCTVLMDQSKGYELPLFTHWSYKHLFVIHQSHGNDVTSTMASQITGNSTVCSTICSEEHIGKHQSSAILVFCEGVHRFPSQRASNAKNIFLSWHHHELFTSYYGLICYSDDKMGDSPVSVLLWWWTTKILKSQVSNQPPEMENRDKIW